MKLYEIKQNVKDSNISRNILDISKISQRLALYIECIDQDIATCDYDYLTSTTYKVKTILAIAEQILQMYVNDTVSKQYTIE